jgi:hypothetical protein
MLRKTWGSHDFALLPLNNGLAKKQKKHPKPKKKFDRGTPKGHLTGGKLQFTLPFYLVLSLLGKERREAAEPGELAPQCVRAGDGGPSGSRGGDRVV